MNFDLNHKQFKDPKKIFKIFKYLIPAITLKSINIFQITGLNIKNILFFDLFTIYYHFMSKTFERGKLPLKNKPHAILNIKLLTLLLFAAFC